MQSDGNEQLSADKMRQLKAQRMQALMREVSGLAAMPNRTIQGNGFSLLGNGLRRPGDASSNRREDSMGFGPQRRDGRSQRAFKDTHFTAACAQHL